MQISMCWTDQRSVSYRALDAAQHEQQHDYDASPVLAYRHTQGIGTRRILQQQPTGM